LISIVLSALSLALFLAAPDQVAGWYFDKLVELQRDQDPEDREPLPPRAKFVRETQIQGIAGSAVTLICSFLVAYGGICMKQLHGYGWAITGSILAAIPCTSYCCCAGTPIGLWALVTLFGSDVRLGFARVGAVGGLGAYEVPGSRDEDPPSRPIRLE
jgi:hypothetical protein